MKFLVKELQTICLVFCVMYLTIFAAGMIVASRMPITFEMLAVLCFFQAGAMTLVMAAIAWSESRHEK